MAKKVIQERQVIEKHIHAINKDDLQKKVQEVLAEVPEHIKSSFIIKGLVTIRIYSKNKD